MKIGVIGTALKANEQRVPIHIEHLNLLPETLKENLFFEKGYGERFKVSDQDLVQQVGGLSSREELLQTMDAVILLKPVTKDFQSLREGGILWGYPHCVQQRAHAQAAIDRKLTLMAFEEMFIWGPKGEQGLHTFYKNNELAGYCAVIHALQLKGIDGHYGRQRKVLIFSFGAVSRGAIYALKARGFKDITICIQRPEHLVREEVQGCDYVRLQDDETQNNTRLMTVEPNGDEKPLIDLISESDILVNGTFQDPNNPMMFIDESEIDCLKPNTLILDISCDQGMGFPFARPTSFAEPIIHIGKIDYYAVDHTPSYLWESASWEISKALIRYLPAFAQGPERWQKVATLRRAIEIDRGIIQNPNILSFQHRQAEYPHLPLENTSITL